VFDETSGVTPRHLLMYISALPFESSTMATLRGDGHGTSWSPDTYMLANVVDLIAWGNYQFVSANSKKKPKAPKPIDRPGTAAQNKPKTNQFAAMARLAHGANTRK
jgi:hypothetical protein